MRRQLDPVVETGSGVVHVVPRLLTHRRFPPIGAELGHQIRARIVGLHLRFDKDAIDRSGRESSARRWAKNGRCIQPVAR